MNFNLILFYSLTMLIMVSSKKKVKISKNIIEKKKFRTFPTLKLSFTGSMRQDFAMEALLLNETQNVVCSPVSAMMPLGKLALGVKGRAESEILELLGLNTQVEVLGKFQQLVFYLEHLPGVKLKMTSRLYVPIPYKSNIIAKFKSDALFSFKTDIDELDFDDSEQAAENINDYVRIKTTYAIDEIITPEEIPSKESILVVNAISFEANWKLKFDRTNNLPFYSTRLRHTVVVPMMTRKGKFFITNSDALNARLVEIQFELNHASMVVILPNSVIGLGYLIRKIKDKPELLNEALRNMTLEEVSVSIPKFDVVETTIDLEELYKTIGLFHIFRKKSGLTRIIQNKELKVARAIQKCSFQIDTESSIAEGSAISEMKLTSGSKNEFTFTVDKPFLYYVIMKTLNEQLFVGIYNEFETA